MWRARKMASFGSTSLPAKCLMTRKIGKKLLAAAVLTAVAVAQQVAPACPENGSEREQKLEERIRILEERLRAVESRLGPEPGAAAVLSPPNQASPSRPDPPTETAHSATEAPATKFAVLLDGYYEYNFNHPIGRVSLLRPFDPTSNSFTLNQAVVELERPADLSAGRSFGGVLDLVLGQMSMAAANQSNEPRPDAYRYLWQAYGTYIAPVGKGLTVDFGRFGSPLGFEGPIDKDDFNYTRSLIFAALPFYHMGFRSTYPVSKSVALTWGLVNGINQMEDFNGFKSNLFTATVSPSSRITWTSLYYVGQEQRDLVPATGDGASLAAQPGFSITPISPAPNGRTHIADTYLSWSMTPNLTIAGESTYFLNRLYSNSAPSDAAAAALYAKYQLTPTFFLAGRAEYFSDRGYLTGLTQSLNEVTLTAGYQPVSGFQLRWEVRRDGSNRRFFLTSVPGVLSENQTTATMAMLWWFGK